MSKPNFPSTKTDSADAVNASASPTKANSRPAMSRLFDGTDSREFRLLTMFRNLDEQQQKAFLTNAGRYVDGVASLHECLLGFVVDGGKPSTEARVIVDQVKANHPAAGWDERMSSTQGSAA